METLLSGLAFSLFVAAQFLAVMHGAARTAETHAKSKPDPSRGEGTAIDHSRRVRWGRPTRISTMVRDMLTGVPAPMHVASGMGWPACR